MNVRRMHRRDADAVLGIYQQGIDTGHATFQSAPPGWAEWNAGHLGKCRLAVDCDGAIAGWAALSAVSSRWVYAGVAEVSIYIAKEARGRGIGRRLLGELITRSEAAGIWTLQAGIFPENEASIALHHALGFRTVGMRHKLGKMEYGPLAGRWRDVAFLERRSERVGND